MTQKTGVLAPMEYSQRGDHSIKICFCYTDKFECMINTHCAHLAESIDMFI